MATKYGIFEIPTKEARVYANRKPQLVSIIYDKFDDELKSLLDAFNTSGYIDEMISHYAVRSIKN